MELNGFWNHRTAENSSFRQSQFPLFICNANKNATKAELTMLNSFWILQHHTSLHERRMRDSKWKHTNCHQRHTTHNIGAREVCDTPEDTGVGWRF